MGCGDGETEEEDDGGASPGGSLDNGDDGDGDDGDGDSGDGDGGDGDDGDGDDGDGDDGDGDSGDGDGDSDSDSDDTTTITNLLAKASSVDGVHCEVFATLYSVNGTVTTQEWWMEEDKARCEFDAIITGNTTIWIYDYAEDLWYSWLEGEDTGIMYAIGNMTEDGLDSQADDTLLQYNPTIVGTETLDGKTCTVIQYADTATNRVWKAWIWNQYGFTLKMEVREAGTLTMKMEWKDVEIGDIDDSKFVPPSYIDWTDMTYLIP